MTTKNEALRVLQVVEPGCDGVFRHVEGLVHYLLSAGVEVDFAYSDVRGSDRLHRLVGAVRDKGGLTTNLRTSNSPQPADLPAFVKLLKLAASHPCAVIHSHSSKAGILGRAVAMLLRKPSFYTPNAYFGMGNPLGLKTSVFNLLEQIFSPFATTINVSPDEATFGRETLRVAQSKQIVIPNAVDTSHFTAGDPDEKRKWRSEHGLQGAAVVIGTLGRLSYQKDPLTLYRAFHACAADFPEVFLAHVGSGELSADCTAYADQHGLSNRILRINYLSDTAGFYQGIDAFALSSRYEGLSFAILEALSAGLPLILTNAPGNGTFSQLGLSHLWTAPVEDPTSFADSIRRFLIDRKPGRVCNHRSVAETNFGFEACYGRILHLYRGSRKRVGEL